MKPYKALTKCDNIVKHHRKKRIRKKNLSRAARIIYKAWKVVAKNRAASEEFFTYMGWNK